MALAAVSVNGDGLAFEHRKVGILIIIGFHEILRMINHGTRRNAAVPNCKRLPVWKPAPSPQPALAGIGKQQDRKRAAVRYSSTCNRQKKYEHLQSSRNADATRAFFNRYGSLSREMLCTAAPFRAGTEPANPARAFRNRRITAWSNNVAALPRCQAIHFSRT